jgi:hypothetical protein
MGWRHTPLVTGAASVPAITSAASDVHDVPEEGRASEPKNMAPPGPSPTFNIPTDLTQPLVEANSELKRLQQDLLILTSFNDNSSLYWRPSWFNAPSLSADLWTLHNPPHVVSEQLPRRPQGRQIMTRRLRRFRDAEPAYIKTQKDWNRHCNLYGVPHDFLCEDQVRLLRLGLPRTVDEWGSMDGMIGPPLEIQTLCGRFAPFPAFGSRLIVFRTSRLASLPGATNTHSGQLLSRSQYVHQFARQICESCKQHARLGHRRAS